MGQVDLRSGIYLEDHKPRVEQFREGRRVAVRSVGVVHTFESGRSWNTLRGAEFIRDRDEHGSYHLAGDEAGDLIQLIRFEDEAFHDATGSNLWATSIALLMSASEWSKRMDRDRRAGLINSAASMAAIVGHWHISEGRLPPAARRLTKAESDRPGASGWIGHDWRDPTRRTDPGNDFPWREFFDLYKLKLRQEPKPMPPPPIPVSGSYLIRFQQALLDAGLTIRHSEPTDQPDGDFGPVMYSTCLELLARPMVPPVQPGDVPAAIQAKADMFDRWAAATRDIDKAKRMALDQ